MDKSKKLLNQLIEKFGNNKVKSHAYTLKLTSELLYSIFEIVNEIVFSNKLDKIQIQLKLKTNKIPGKAKFCFNVKTKERFIVVYYRKYGDNFQKVLNAICHEMIHYYDFCFGPWSKQVEKYNLVTDFEKLEQFVGKYNIHGDYFMSWIREFKKQGVIVEKYYSENLVKDLFFKENATQNKQDEQDRKMEKTIYDSILTDGFKAVSVEQGNIFVVVD